MSPITGKTYDYLKFLAQILLPALGTLYFGLAGIWGLPNADEVVGTIVVVDTFLGVVLGLSQKAYDKQVATGDLTLEQTEHGKVYGLELDGDPEYELQGKKEVRFRVKKKSTTKK